MKEKEFRKLVRNEIKNILDEGMFSFDPKKELGDKVVKPTVSDLVSKFYMFIINNDLEKAKLYLRNNPKLIKMAKNIKLQSDTLAKELLSDDDFLEFLKKK